MPTKDVKQIEDMCCLSVCQLVHVSNAHSGSMRPYPCKANLQISAVWLIRHLGFPDAVGYSLGLIGCPMGLKIRASCILSAKAGAVPVLISPCSCFDHMTVTATRESSANSRLCKRFLLDADLADSQQARSLLQLPLCRRAIVASAG